MNRKEFKSEAQQQQHFTSKPHRKKAQDLVRQEKTREAKMNPKKGKGHVTKNTDVPIPVKEVKEDSKQQQPQNGKKRVAHRPANTNAFAFDSDSSDADSSDAEEEKEVVQKSPQSAKKSRGSDATDSDSDSDGDGDSSSDGDDLLQLSQIKISKQRERKQPCDDNSSDEGDEDEDKDKDTAPAEHSEVGVETEYEIITPGGPPHSAGGTLPLQTPPVHHQGKKQRGQHEQQQAQSAHAGATSSSATVCKICGFDAQGSRNKCEWLV
jgi:hypothetical protein